MDGDFFFVYIEEQIAEQRETLRRVLMNNVFIKIYKEKRMYSSGKAAF